MSADHKTITTLLRESLATGRPASLTVTSGSMRPLLHEGDQIELITVHLETLTSGDIIVFDSGRALFTHRLRHITQQNGRTYLRTRGDRLIHYDPPFTTDALLGRVTSRTRHGRTTPLTPHNRQHQRLRQLATLEERWLGRFGSLTTPPPTLFQRLIHFKFKLLGRLITL